MDPESHRLVTWHRPASSRIGEFQAAVARALFSTPESKGFFIAGAAAPIKSLRASFLGPVLDPEDSTGQKTLALFGRAQPRDFAGVRRLVQSFGMARLLELAAERDTGFDPQVFAQMPGLLRSINDRQIPLPADEIPRLCRFFEQWAAALMSQSSR